MNHERIIENISLLLDGELSDKEETEARAHLEDCVECRSLYEAAAGAGRLLRGEPEPAPSTSFVEETMRRVREAEEEDPLPTRVWVPAFAAGLAAIVLLLQPAPPPASAFDGPFLAASALEAPPETPVTAPTLDELGGISLEDL